MTDSANVARPKPPRLALIFIFITALMDSIGFGIIMPVLPDLLMDVTGEDLASAARYSGFLMLAFAVTQFIFAPILGNLSDHYGRRPILLGSIIVLAINYVLMGVAESLVLLFIGRLISGVGSATFSTCNAYIADITAVEERAQYFGMMGAAFGLGFVIGPVIGGLLGDFGPRIPFFAAALLLACNLVLGFLVLPESLKPENRRTFVLRQANPLSTFIRLSEFRVVFGLMGVMFLYNLGHHSLPAIWSFWGIERFDWSTAEIGYSLGFIGILMTVVQGFLIRLIIPAMGLRWAGIAGLTLNAIAFAGYAMANSTLMVYVVMVPAALAAITGPAMNGIASSHVGAERQGELQGGLSSLMSLTSIISPPVMTQTFALFTGAGAIIYFPGAPFVLASLLTIMALTLFIVATQGFTSPSEVKP